MSVSVSEAIFELDDETDTRNPSFRTNLLNYFKDYCSHAEIHALRYVGSKRSPTEKLFWLSFVGFTFCLTIIFILQAYKRSEIVILGRNPEPVWQIPFPAVTICPQTKFQGSVLKFSDHYHKVLNQDDAEDELQNEDLEKFAHASLVCDNHLYNSGNKTTTHKSIDFLKDASPEMNQVFFACKWMTGLNETCNDLFSPTVTDDGICFTFNMLSLRKELVTDKMYLHYSTDMEESQGWTLENGYPKSSERNTYPRRAISGGTLSGFFLLLSANIHDLDYICQGPVQGFKVLLHHPAEYPRVVNKYFQVPLSQEVMVSIKPEVITTSGLLRNYDSDRRQCFFSSERQLMFFQIYTEENCRLECAANYTLERCGCVAYYMPHENGTSICGSGSVRCMVEASKQLAVDEVEAGISRRNSDDSNLKTRCNCLPSCTTINYHAETSYATFNWMEVIKAFKTNVDESPGIQLSRLSIFFKDSRFVSFERTELTTHVDFLAKLGGLLALFTGISLVSCVEIIYFLTLRLWCNIKIYGSHLWGGEIN